MTQLFADLQMSPINVDHIENREALDLRSFPFPKASVRNQSSTAPCSEHREMVPSTQEEEQMQKAADNSKAKREAAKKEREAREAGELMKKAAESSKNRRKKDGSSN
ncbi:hypothetical protein GQ44DRAFT_780402 [Phaeosphaeriaceae sp. PMI808]|nr:hypothetical protein GQ44DRAFT_780402 [Phaeosphaeriaceae sp. PMI808]